MTVIFYDLYIKIMIAYWLIKARINLSHIMFLRVNMLPWIYGTYRFILADSKLNLVTNVKYSGYFYSLERKILYAYLEVAES